MGTKNSAHASVALFTDYLIIFKTERSLMLRNLLSERTEFQLGDDQEFGGSVFAILQCS